MRKFTLIIERNPSLLLFSEELFLDTRLSQQSTGGVHVHIEDGLAGVQRRSRLKNPLKTPVDQNESIMRNKPNFRNAEMNVRTVITKDYENIYPRGRLENKPNSKPIQTQYEPETKPIKPNFKPAKSDSS